MPKCQHRFVAYPITGINVWTAKETLFGFKVECEKCHKIAPDGAEVIAIKPSWYKQVYPEEITLKERA